MAVLNRQMTATFIEADDSLRVHWLALKQPFDFDSVEIIQATDKEVEQFAMLIGNDTDPVRQANYKQAPCFIASGCQLSANTCRILERQFKQVKFGENATR